MFDALLIVLPVFGLIAVGFAARLSGLIGDRTGDGLADFVFTIAVPCLIFRTLARAQLPEIQPWGYWISYFAAIAFVWPIAMWIAKRHFAATPTEAVVAGFSSGQSNTVLVGIPLILQAYGEAGAVPLFLLLAIHLPITMTTATLLAEGRGVAPLALARKLVSHPLIVAVLAGSAARLVPPDVFPTASAGVFWKIVDALGDAAVPCALVGMGVALRRYGFSAGWRLPAIVAALKLVVHPLIVLLLALYVFGLPPVWTGVAVLFAASPCGINAYLFAERYREGVAIASSSIALSTAAALFTTVAWLAILQALPR